MLKLRSKNSVALATILLVVSTVVYYLVAPAWNERALKRLEKEYDGISYRTGGVIPLQKRLWVKGDRNFNRTKRYLGNLLDLHELDLSNVTLSSSVVERIGQLKVPCLGIYKCKIHSDVDWSCFEANTHLKKISIDSESISDDDLTSFGQCPNLWKVDIGAPQIRGKFVEGGFNSLRELSIRHPSVEALRSICKLEQLRILQLTRIDFDLNELAHLGVMPSLTTLRLPLYVRDKGVRELLVEPRRLIREVRMQAIEDGVQFDSPNDFPL